MVLASDSRGVEARSCPLHGQPPIHPQPASDRAPLLTRVLRGLYSWLEIPVAYNYESYGATDRLMGVELAMVSDPKQIRRIKVDRYEQYPKHPLLEWTLAPLIGQAIFSVNGATWVQQRLLLDQALKHAQLRRVCGSMQGAVEDWLRPLVPLADGRSLEIQESITAVTADVILRTILSRALEPREGKPVFAAFVRYQRKAARAGLLRLVGVPQQLLSRGLARQAAPIRGWIDRCVGERLEVDPASRPKDVLQALIDAVDPHSGARFDRQALVDQVCLLFLAGHETSASSLAMAVYLLAQYPDVQQRLREAVDAALLSRAAPPDATLEFEDLRRLDYGEAIFNEVLRLYPPVSFLFHGRQEGPDSEPLGSAKPGCPMASLLVISPWVVHRHRRHWSHPDCFNPDRFYAATASSHDRQMAREAFLPFGMGPRQCPGAGFARQEALLVLGELVRRFVVHPDPGHRPALVGRLTLRSRNGIRVRLTPRS